MEAKITNLRELALRLDEAPVNMSIIGKNLQKRIALWIKRGEVKTLDGKIFLAY